MPNTSNPKSALIVIDVQESFAQMPFWPQGLHAPFQQALLKLDAGARAAGVPVVHIFHVGQGGPFREDSGFVKPLAWLPGDPAVRFDKHTHNAFTDTGLDLWLRRQGVTKLIISGIRTEQCCETTARVGADLGYEVDFVSEATLTFPQTLVLRYAHFESPQRRQPQVATDYSRWFLARLRAVDAALSEQDALCASRFTAADVSVGYALMLATHLGLAPQFPEAVGRYWDRLQQRPAFQRALQAQHLAAIDQGVPTLAAPDVRPD